MAKPVPLPGTVPSIKPPQPSGLLPAGGVGRNSVTTQPMSMPVRPAAPTISEGNKSRATQRLLVTANAAGKMASSRPIAAAAGSARLIHLPAGMILRCLPPEMLAAPLAQFEASGAAATEVGLPMTAILSQVPSGKVELPVRDLIARFPPGLLKPAAELRSQMDTAVSLPLMDIVMRIPPDLLAVRPDQKDVDASVRRMADPFTEDALARAAAESAASAPPPVPTPVIVPADEAPVVEESPGETGSGEPVPKGPPPMPVPVPASASRAFVPPARHASMPLLSQTDTLSGRLVTRPVPMPPRVIPAFPAAPAVPPAVPEQQLSASQILGVPRPSIAPPVALPPLPSLPPDPDPEPPGASGLIVPPPTLQTPFKETVVMPPAAKPVPAAEPPSGVQAEELQRLAALAMAEIGDRPGTETEQAMEVVDNGPLIGTKATEPMTNPPVPVEDIDPGFAVTARLPEAPPPPVVRETPPVSPVLPVLPVVLPPPSEPIRAFAPPEPIRLPTQAEPIRPPLTASDPNRSSGVTEAIRPPGDQPVPTRETTRVTPPFPPTPVADAPAPVALTPVPEPVATAASAPTPIAPASTEPASSAPATTAVNLNNCVADDLLPIPGMTRELAENIIQHRDKIGEFHKLDELLDVPGMTRAAYSTLTGEMPSSGVHPSINELLGFPPEQELSLKDVTDRIACWPDVIGCLLSQKNGLHLVGTAPDFLDKEAIVAFTPRLFEDLNKSFGEITGRGSDELIIPTTGTSFHLLREKELYLIILSRLPQMPERHLKIARFVLAGLGSRPS